MHTHFLFPHNDKEQFSSTFCPGASFYCAAHLVVLNVQTIDSIEFYVHLEKKSAGLFSHKLVENAYLSIKLELVIKIRKVLMSKIGEILWKPSVMCFMIARD